VPSDYLLGQSGLFDLRYEAIDKFYRARLRREGGIGKTLMKISKIEENFKQGNLYRLGKI